MTQIKNLPKSKRWLTRPLGDTFVAGGFKCDAPDCDYVESDTNKPDINIVADYINYIISYKDKTCPLCGAPLLTDKDLYATLALLRVVYSTPYQIILSITKKLGIKHKVCRMELDGNGNMSFKEK
jgi:hypothetical protein